MSDAEDVLAELRRVCDRDTCTCAVQAGIREIQRLRDEVDRLDKKCSALAFLQYGRPEETSDEPLRRIIAAYDAYRGRGVSPAPNEYANLVEAIDMARLALKAGGDV